MKDLEFRLISQLMKNSKVSDRELAKKLGVSQPTVSRTRMKLEKKGYIREYTVIPDFVKLGFQIASFVLVKMKEGLSKDEVMKARQISMKDMREKAPDEIVLFNRGLGGGYGAVLVSFHKTYSDFTQLMRRVNQYPFVDTSATLAFLVDLNDEVQYRPFTFSTLAKHVLTMKEQAKK